MSKKEFVIAGECYNDIHNRFRDGSHVITSGIKNIVVKEGDIIKTRDSMYTLGKQAVSTES